MSCSCFSYVVTFLIAIQLWTLTSRSGSTGLMTSEASVRFPGEMNPESLSILIGDDANIMCRLTEPNSLNIWFVEEKSRRAIKQPSDEIQVLDPYTAVLNIRKAVEQNSIYQCRVGDYAIGESHLYVGTKPLNVTDFSCKSYDYEYLECSFTKPKNMVLPRYKLRYTLPKDNSTVYACSCQDDGKNTVKCNVTDYMPMREKYIFSLYGTNDVGENIQKFIIHNHKIVIPSAVDIVKQIITSDSISLYLEKLKISYYVKSGLTYDIQIRDNYTNWRTANSTELDCQNGRCSITVINLYAYWLYWISVRVKSNAVDNDDFWSDQSTISFRTEAARPKRPPVIPLGSFYIDSTETQLRLYWEQLLDHEHNGPGFHYVISEINEEDIIMFSTKANESSTTFKWRNESMQIFSIKSANDVGECTEQNIIRVYRSGNSHFEVNNIAKLYHNRSYLLSWSPPASIEQLTNYTVFWCLPKIEIPNECKGPTSYKYLDKLATNYTTEPKERSLNLAISANYPNYNKGMQWARCSGDSSSELMKMELEISVINVSSIIVKWSSGSVCASILKGYNLTYCEATIDNKCAKPLITLELLREKQEYRNYTISKLPPFTNVCLYMFMYTSSNYGRASDLNCVRTKATAPYPPIDVEYIVKTVTSKSAQIRWIPPNIKNGILSHYTVYWRKYPDQIFEKNTTSIDQTLYNLTGLHSYSKYEVYVTAYTIQESLPSERIHFTTLIGIPSGPRNLNIYENDTLIYWDPPDLPSGRHIFYVVALVRKHGKHNEIYERVSVVKGRSCRFKQPNCANSNKSYALKVRAVNVGEIEEVDQDIIDMDKDVIFAGAPIDENFCEPDDEDLIATSFFQNDNDKFYFASPWIVAPRSYSCSTSSKAYLYTVAFVIVMSFVVYICNWLRNKYYNMKNITVILPEGLVEQVSNYKFATKTLGNDSDFESPTKNQFISDISGSNDCLVSSEHKDKINLIRNFYKNVPITQNTISVMNNYTDHYNTEQFGAHPAVETANEELSSTPSSPSDSYHNNHPINRLSSSDNDNSTPVLEEDEEVNDGESDSNEHSEDVENLKHLTVQGNNDYVTNNLQLLASILSGPTKKSVQPTTFPNMTEDGYIQQSVAKQLFQPSFSNHQKQPQTSFDDYTCIESLSKPISQSIPNSAVANEIPLSTTPLNLVSTPTAIVPAVITDLKESPSAEYNKDPLHPVVTPATATNTSQQLINNNSNNTTIDGYVTQQQLANFGTNVALGKQLNT